MSRRHDAPGAKLNAAGRRWGGERWRGKLTIPQHAHPIVRALIAEMNRQHTTYDEVAAKAGLRHRTVSGWRHERNPQLVTIIAALNAIGLDLAVVRKGDD